MVNNNVPTINPNVTATPSKFAVNQMAGNAQKQAELNQKYAGGATNNTVPMVASRYQSYSGPNQDAGATQINNFKVTQQSGANAKYDHLAYQKGGRMRMRMRRATRATRRHGKKNRRRATRTRARARSTRRRSRTMRRY